LTALPCPKRERCPGCPLGAQEYAAGLELKAAAVRRALADYAELTPSVTPARGAESPLAYRLRAKLVSKGRALGLFERGSHRVLDVSGCLVLSPALTHASDALRRRLPLPIYGADLRDTSEGVLVTLLSEEPSARSELERVAREMVDAHEALGVALAFRRPGDVRLLAGTPEVAAGPTEARHALAPGKPYGYAAHGGFVQAHAEQASYVYSELARGITARAATPAPRVLELFAGNGSLALALAQSGARITAVEAYAPAIRLAERAAREQGLELAIVAGDATRFASELSAGRFDAIVVNPPRRGLDPALREAIGRAAPRTLGYVSCNPSTLARDAWHLSRLGLRLASAEPLDMIPWSDAVEVLSWFEPTPVPEPRVLFESDELLAVDKPPHESRTSLTARVRQRPGAETARALDDFGHGVSGACWFEKRGSGAKPGERELLLACRGNLRKQGTISRRDSNDGGTRYRKQAELGRHSLVSARVNDASELAALRDFASIRHPVLGERSSRLGDAETSDFVQHRHGLDRVFVHVTQSSLALPSGQLVTAQSSLAPDLAEVVRSLGSD
jgi:23S rRNA (uracil1939-C5)-methyltransferase